MTDETITQATDKTHQKSIKETVLEFVQQEDGKLVLRESLNKDEVLLTIDFSDKVKEMLGGEMHYIGEAMISAAMGAVMRRQMSHYHAHVYDEEPVHYS